MPQLDITTFYTQRFWLIVIFLLRYITIGCQYLPRLSYIIKYRREYQEERDWTVTTFANEVGIYKDILMDFNSHKRACSKILTRYNNSVNEYLTENQKHRRIIQNSTIPQILETQSKILLTIKKLNNI